MPIPHEYTIWAARPEHIPFLNDIELAAATIFPPGSIPTHILSESVPEDTLTDAMREGRLWVALGLGVKPVGYGLLQFVGDAALLAQLDVHPDHGRRGLGAALVRRVAETARSRGAEALYLTSFAQILGMRRFTPALVLSRLRKLISRDGFGIFLRKSEAAGLKIARLCAWL